MTTNTPSDKEAFLRRCSVDPLFWRQSLTLDGVMWGSRMVDLQIKDFQAIDPGLLYKSGMSNVKPKYQRFWYQRSRGYSKTTDIASTCLWLWTFTQRYLKGFVAAGDKEQTYFLRDSLAQLLNENPWLNSFVDLKRGALESKRTGSLLQFTSSDTNSSFGASPDFIVCDEFTHWEEKAEGFWNSIFTSFGKRVDQGALLVCACNAGSGAGYQWNVRQNAIASDAWYFSSPSGASPWYSEEMLDEQRKLLDAYTFSRYWENEWQYDAFGFLSLAEAEACVDDSLIYRTHPQEDTAIYVASVDYAEKHDRTVGVLMHLNNGHIYIDRMDVVDPTNPLQCPDGVVNIEWVEKWIEHINNVFGSGSTMDGWSRNVHFIGDPHQLKYVFSRLRDKGIQVNEFEFKSGKGNWELSTALRHMVLHGKLHWYPECGKLELPSGQRDDLCTELSKLYAQPLPNSRWRLQHRQGEFDDRAFTVGAGVHFIVNSINNTGYSEYAEIW